MKVNYFSIQGSRKENEDFILSEQLDANISMHIVADGMGGYENGRLAAETVANTIFSSIKEDDLIDTVESLKKAVFNANKAIKVILQADNIKLGSTVGGCLISDDKAYLFWVGDVKIIQVRKGKIIFESEDHSLINQLKKNGNIDSGLNLNSIRHVVTKSINGEESKYEPDIKEVSIEAGDKIVICSDGVLDKTRIEDLATIDFEDEKMLEDLKGKYIDNTDNSSIIVINI